ncbi:MAG: hypothetical protein HYZ73_07085 [Elusimicrobia bacterium]|nr:hypothetical protein [Elusimicrobiota bacterium]
MPNHNAILFLGSGATASSGITGQTEETKREDLPADSEFFASPLVRKDIKRHYPALSLFRSLKEQDAPSGSLARKSLYETWNDLFIYRGLAQANLFFETRNLKDSFYALANHNWPTGCERQKEHYKFQFAIMEAFKPWQFYLAELAIWELRSLVRQTYLIDEMESKPDRILWGRLKKYLTAIINLNYDITFDTNVQDEFYYPGNSEPRRDKIPLIRPHGSLVWSSIGTWVHQRGWQGWRDSWEKTCEDQLGFRQLGDGNLELRQPLLVSPTYFKEEVVGNSSLPGLQSEILRPQWLKLEEVSRTSKHWIFIGASLSSGDDHLVYLLRRSYSQQQICVSWHKEGKKDKKEEIKKEKIKERLKQITRTNAPPYCWHPINKTIDKFLQKRSCHLLSQKLTRSFNRGPDAEKR